MQDAKECFTHSWDFFPAYLNYAACNEYLGRHEETLKTLDQVLALKPDYGEALEFKINSSNSFVDIRRRFLRSSNYGKSTLIIPCSKSGMQGC